MKSETRAGSTISFVVSLIVLSSFAIPRESRGGPTRPGSGKRQHRAQMRQLTRQLKEKQRKQAAEIQKQITTDLKRIGIQPRVGPVPGRASETKMLERLRDPDPARRAEAAWWAGVHRVKAARFRLVRLLKDSQPEVRANAVYALGRLDLRHMGSALFDILERDKNVAVRGRAAEALGRFQYRRALPLLLRMLRAKDLRLRIGALEGLGFMREPSTLGRIAKLARHKDPQIRAKATAALGRMRLRKCVVHLNRALDDSEGQVVAAALAGLAGLGATALIPRMEKLLEHSSEEVKQAAVEALTQLDAVRSIPLIRKLARKARPLTAAHCAVAVTRLGGKFPAGLLKRLIDSKDNRIRVMGVRSAGFASARWAIKKIRKLLSHPHEPLRIAACKALGHLEAYAATEELVERLKDPSEEVRIAAINALSRTGGRRALAACAILLADANPLVSAAAARCMARRARADWMLARYATKRLAAMLRLKADPRVAAAASHALAVVGVEKNRKAMIRLLRLTLHNKPECRAAAAWALGFVGRADLRESRRSLERLFTRDASLEVRLMAGIGAGRLGMRKILPQLAQLFREQKSDKQLTERFMAALGLAMMERGWRPEATRLFLRLVSKRPNLPSKIRLVEMMAAMGTRWARAAVRRAATESKNPLVRSAARNRLGMKPPPPRPVPEDTGFPADPSPPPEPRTARPKPKPVAKKPKKTERTVGGPFPLPPESKRDPTRRGCSGCGCRTAPGLSDLPMFVLIAFVVLLMAGRLRDDV